MKISVFEHHNVKEYEDKSLLNAIDYILKIHNSAEAFEQGLRIRKLILWLLEGLEFIRNFSSFGSITSKA